MTRARALHLARTRDTGDGVIVASCAERVCAVRAVWDAAEATGDTARQDALLTVLERLPLANLRAERTAAFVRAHDECAERLAVHQRLAAVPLDDLDAPQRAALRWIA